MRCSTMAMRCCSRRCCKKLFGVGLDPTFGVSHVARERSTPLAYDLMEPFRPCVDWRVAQWAQKMRNGERRNAE